MTVKSPIFQGFSTTAHSLSHSHRVCSVVIVRNVITMSKLHPLRKTKNRRKTSRTFGFCFYEINIIFRYVYTYICVSVDHL